MRDAQPIGINSRQETHDREGIHLFEGSYESKFISGWDPGEVTTQTLDPGIPVAVLPGEALLD